mgnify:CR=1 FL=1
MNRKEEKGIELGEAVSGSWSVVEVVPQPEQQEETGKSSQQQQRTNGKLGPRHIILLIEMTFLTMSVMYVEMCMVSC